ncbi:MAG: dTMP kinase [Anaerolineae bacterium]
MFITFEGPEGSGKSTQVRMLAEYLRERGQDVLLTREPGGTAIGDQIRAILHSHDNAGMVPTGELLLYNAARAQIVSEVIRPALAAGRVVLSDRYADSTIAYQGYGRQIDLDAVKQVIHLATGGLKPDLTFLIDVSVETGLARRKDGARRGEEWTRMDSLAIEFYERVREGYCILMREEPERWVRIDGTPGIQAVQNELRRQMDYALEQFHLHRTDYHGYRTA